MRRYTVVLTPDTDDGGFVVTVPSLPGCVTQGETVEQAIDRAREAIHGFIETLVALGEPVPTDDVVPQVMSVEVPDDVASVA
jgi:predicted RNase H-like HicB family nuclease